MKSEFRGCLTIHDQFAHEGVQTALELTMKFLDATIESPFVAVELQDERSDTPAAYVIHGEALGQYHLIGRKPDPYGGSADSWRVHNAQPLQWLMQDMLDLLSVGCYDVELVDIAVARHRLRDAEFDQPSKRAALDETERVEHNRNLAFSGMSPTPHFVEDLVTEPAYEKSEALAAGERSHQKRMERSAGQ